MLLLLLSEDQIKILSDKTISVKLQDLFEIQTGVIDDPEIEYYIQEANSTKKKVRKARIGSFDSRTRKLKGLDELNEAEIRLEQLRNDRKGKAMLRKQEKQNKDTSQTCQLIELSNDKILTQYDYLINPRGIGANSIIGYSMLNSIDKKSEILLEPMVPTNHFIKLSPRGIINNISIDFLHLALDLIVEHYSKIPKFQTSILRIRDLKNEELKIPAEKSKQEEIVKKFSELKEKKLEIEKEIEEYKSKFIFDPNYIYHSINNSN